MPIGREGCEPLREYLDQFPVEDNPLFLPKSIEELEELRRERVTAAMKPPAIQMQCRML